MAFGHMDAAMKGVTDAVTIAAVSELTQALHEATAEVLGARAAIDRAAAGVRQVASTLGRG